MDQCDEFGHCNSYFDQYRHKCGNSCDYGWDNQGAYNDSRYFYDYQLQNVQYESKSSWELAIEKLLMHFCLRS